MQGWDYSQNSTENLILGMAEAHYLGATASGRYGVRRVAYRLAGLGLVEITLTIAIFIDTAETRILRHRHVL